LQKDRVYPGRREKFARRCQRDVKRWEAEQPAALVSTNDASAERVAATQHPGGVVQVPIRHSASYGTRRHRDSVDRNGIDYLDSKVVTAPELAKHVNIPRTASSKSVIVTNEELANAIPIEQDSFDEGGRIERSEASGEWHNHGVLDTRVSDDLELLGDRRQQSRRG
jgi:hypothetical protein